MKNQVRIAFLSCIIPTTKRHNCLLLYLKTRDPKVATGLSLEKAKQNRRERERETLLTTWIYLYSNYVHYQVVYLGDLLHIYFSEVMSKKVNHSWEIVTAQIKNTFIIRKTNGLNIMSCLKETKICLFVCVNKQWSSKGGWIIWSRQWNKVSSVWWALVV